MLRRCGWPTTSGRSATRPADDAVGHQPMISAALLWGPWSGIETALVIGASSTIVKRTFDPKPGPQRDGHRRSRPGWLSGSPVRPPADRTRRSPRPNAAPPRPRNANGSRATSTTGGRRWAYIAKHGREIGGPSTRLAEMAGEQERALRKMLRRHERHRRRRHERSRRGGSVDDARRRRWDSGTVDLAAALRGAGRRRRVGERPGTPVPVGRAVAGELRAALANAIANTRTHAGPGARSYVLLRDLGDEVVVSVRDDGVSASPPPPRTKPGGTAGWGVKSIVGRIEALAGGRRWNRLPWGGHRMEWTVGRGIPDGKPGKTRER